MKMAGIVKARKRLSQAREHLAAIRSAGSYEQFEKDWYQLLICANAVDGILEFSASKDNKSRPWYGKKVNIRRGDPLLNYMHQARNADEHGLEDVTEYVPGRRTIGSTGGPMHLYELRMGPEEVYARYDESLPGRPLISLFPTTARLIKVKNEKFGDEFDPPSEHLGKPSSDNSPAGVATIWLDYLEELINEAEGKVTE